MARARCAIRASGMDRSKSRIVVWVIPPEAQPPGADYTKPPLQLGDVERIGGEATAGEALAEAKRIGFVELPLAVAKNMAEQGLSSIAAGSVIKVGGYAFKVAK